MKNYKILKYENLLENLRKFQTKKICAMVKANAYGHGIKEVVKSIENQVECFGVVNIDEAIIVRKLTEKPILICAKTDNFKACKKHNFDVVIDSEFELKAAIKNGLQENLHLKIDCGMNRFGIKSTLDAKILNELLTENQIDLKSICTHFPRTEIRRETLKNYQNFMKIRAEITQDVPLCFGGTGIIRYPFPFDMVRVGIGMYGYGQSGLLPVMQIRSYVSKVFYAQKGNFVGYGKKYKARSDGKFAIVPVGYGDGLRRNLSGKFFVKIGGKKYRAVGNICMDCFFVKVDKTVKVNDEVEVMSDAAYLAKKSGTISYEILTGFSNLRGKTVIEK